MKTTTNFYKQNLFDDYEGHSLCNKEITASSAT